MPDTRLVLPQGRRRSTRLMRALRATWRDTSALWREFRTPILIFLLVVFGGGWLYGELLVLSGYPRVPYVDLPYFILRMMVFEPPTNDVPPELYLIAFWYALPPIAAFIIGRGAIDFVRLFFNRGERRRDWEEAVASTYRNHVIIMGVGHVGLRVARTLVSMGFEVVGIDIKTKPEVEELSRLGVPLILEDGRSPQTLEKAGLRYAQAFVACTANDHTNLEAIMRARDLNPSVRIVARMWDDQFSKQLERFMGVEAVMSASDLAAPAFAGSAVGIEITQTVHVNGQDYSLIRLTVAAGSFMDGQAVGALQREQNMDIVLQGRNGSIEVQPKHDLVVQAGDTLVIFARHDRILTIVSRNRGR
ncbi:MAG TPA: NAD-binding protein [Phototrophicaceae bacterium]|nr:NAD-binding protein [Phototrophicaceae bacterium]